MADMMEYKCPACGGAMEFDSKSQKMKCPYCDSEMSIEEFQSMQQTDRRDEQKEFDMAGGQWQEGETAGMRVYSCQSCGGEIVAEESTGAATCPFCGNRVVMKGQFEGDLKPDYIIPFKLDKKDAKAAYHRHLKGKVFLPPVFRQENHIDEIKGVYVPFWLFDGDVDADICYDAQRVRRWEKDDMEYTECTFYKLHRAGKISFQHIPADGSRKMDDTLMESIEPYNFEEAVPFETPYLAGYVADRYDVGAQECISRAKERIKRSTQTSFQDTVENYSSVQVADSRISILKSEYSYALYPVWLLNTKWQGKKYTFAMNGQTGKMVGDLPFDKKAFQKYVITRGIAIGLVIYVLMWALMTL